MNTTIILAQILGITLTFMGLSLIIDKKGASLLLEEATKNRAILWILGFISLLVGTVLLEFHNTWNTLLQSLITLIGWLALIKGIMILLFGDTLAWFYKHWNKEKTFTVSGIITFIIGLIFVYYGFL